MLSDFLMIESFYEGPATVRFYEELSQKYGPDAIGDAIHSGYIAGKKILFGPDTGRVFFHLTDKGRRKANKEGLSPAVQS